MLLKRQEQLYEKVILLQISQLFKTKEQVLYRLKKLCLLMPATDRFLAETEEPRAGLRSGHSRFNKYPYTQLLKDGNFTQRSVKKIFSTRKTIVHLWIRCNSLYNMIAYELFLITLKQFMMDLGPNGDKIEK
jgi:thiosulfate/3-mercaptopyruvate sulfurtransferase